MSIMVGVGRGAQVGVLTKSCALHRDVGPGPIAIPTSAAARTGASFTPSPAIAATRPAFCSLATTALF
jgi:hypothetical protein